MNEIIFQHVVASIQRAIIIGMLILIYYKLN